MFIHKRVGVATIYLVTLNFIRRLVVKVHQGHSPSLLQKPNQGKALRRVPRCAPSVASSVKRESCTDKAQTHKTGNTQLRFGVDGLPR